MGIACASACENEWPVSTTLRVGHHHYIGSLLQTPTPQEEKQEMTLLALWVLHQHLLWGPNSPYLAEWTLFTRAQLIKSI